MTAERENAIRFAWVEPPLDDIEPMLQAAAVDMRTLYAELVAMREQAERLERVAGAAQRYAATQYSGTHQDLIEALAVLAEQEKQPPPA